MRRAPAKSLAHSGAFIYAYCNVRTNQVLYSLERTLQPRHLKQLPDVGANNTPPTLRKDIWRPLFTVALPQDRNGEQQSKYMFQRLREFRRLHETNWTPSPLLSRSYTQKEIEDMKLELRQRGGSKTETVYDIIKRKKWKMRVNTVMDQKANSVADLAAILLEQDKVGETAAELNVRDQKFHRDQTAKEMLELSKAAEKGEIGNVQNKLESLQTQLETAARKEKRMLYWEISQLELKIKMMEFAASAVAKARESTGSGASIEGQPNTEAEAVPSSGSSALGASQDDATLLPLLPAWPREIDPWIIDANRNNSNWKVKGMPRRSVLHFDRPIATTEGVSVSWANILDSEYAQAWPSAVEHRRMGLSRHVAPIPLESPLNPWQLAGRPEGEEHLGVAEDVPSFKAMQLSRRSKEAAKKRERSMVLEQMKTNILESVANGKGDESVRSTEQKISSPHEVDEPETRQQPLL